MDKLAGKLLNLGANELKNFQFRKEEYRSIRKSKSNSSNEITGFVKIVF